MQLPLTDHIIYIGFGNCDMPGAVKASMLLVYWGGHFHCVSVKLQLVKNCMVISLSKYIKVYFFFLGCNI